VAWRARGGRRLAGRDDAVERTADRRENERSGVAVAGARSKEEAARAGGARSSAGEASGGTGAESIMLLSYHARTTQQ
jgi:hypothetical protein